MNDELYHYGIKGPKWGVRRFQNRDGTRTTAGKKRYDKHDHDSTSVRAEFARRANKKVDKSFDDWEKNDNLKKTAIDLGKKNNENRLLYESDRKNREYKKAYKVSDKEYKKAYSKNTTYRKGQVRKEVGGDLSQKYLRSAKNLKKKLDLSPDDKTLKKQYDTLMSKYEIERAKARRAPDVANKRSKKKAAIKSAMTKSAKAAAATAAVSVGVAAVNKYVLKNDRLNSDKVMDFAKKARKVIGYAY